MSEPTASRFAPQNQTTHQRLTTNTVGLVALSDFRKRRAEVLEQQEREAREAAVAGTSTPDRSQTATPDNAGSDSGSGVAGEARPLKKPKKKLLAKKLLSFDDDYDKDDADDADAATTTTKAKSKFKLPSNTDGDDDASTAIKSKFKANGAVGIVPKAMTKSALHKQASEREALRREFIAIQEAVKATEVAIPFVFYDGANTPGGTVRMKKGDYVWVFLDKSRKVGAELGVGEQANATKAWARVGVDDLMLVRGTVIIPHHYDFYFFAVNKSLGPGGQRIFDYSAEPASVLPTEINPAGSPLLTSESRAAAAKSLPPVSTLEGASDEPTETKVVDRRWYEKNKHIYPASTWQEFDPEKDYSREIRKDLGGNTFFYSK